MKRRWRRQKKFAADASHELRNPLAIIKINLELLRGAKSKPNMDDETQERLTSAALEGVGKMQMVLDDLLVIARASDLDESFFAEKLNLGDVVSSVARDCEPLCEAKGIALTYRCDSKCEVFGDAALLRDMVSVVLDNAILYTERGGAVEVVVDGESPVCGVSVSDTGIGMTEEDVVRVFDRFYRGEAGKVANPSGSGLGIPVAHEIAQRHNAEMRIKSAPGAGTTVSFSFPKR